MTDLDPEVKSGTVGKAGMIAIATALIGAATTISVAYINKGTTAAEVKPNPPTPGPRSDPQPAPEPEPQPAPQPLMQTARQVGGVWTAQDGEQMEVSQSGSRLTLSGGTMTEAGALVWQGYGNINDRNIKWTAQVSANGNQVEAECGGRLTTSGNSIQGMCDMMGQKIPFEYSR